MGRRYFELLLFILQIKLFIFHDFHTAVFCPGNLSEVVSSMRFLNDEGNTGERNGD